MFSMFTVKPNPLVPTALSLYALSWLSLFPGCHLKLCKQYTQSALSFKEPVYVIRLQIYSRNLRDQEETSLSYYLKYAFLSDNYVKESIISEHYYPHVPNKAQ